MPQYFIAALYKFVELADYTDMQAPLLAFCEARGVTGTLLLAREGINGTIAGREDSVLEVLAHLRADPRLADLEHKASCADKLPFYRMKVKLKREIVTMGVPDIDPATMAGTYVPPEQWNALIAEPDVVVVDVRNDYEVSIGSFKGAVNPHTTSFSEFPEWVRQQSGCHVLHGRNTLREIDRLSEITGLQRRIPSARGHPQVSGNHTRRHKPVGRPMLRFR
jgi:UPF0176 protein